MPKNGSETARNYYVYGYIGLYRRKNIYFCHRAENSPAKTHDYIDDENPFFIKDIISRRVKDFFAKTTHIY